MKRMPVTMADISGPCPMVPFERRICKVADIPYSASGERTVERLVSQHDWREHPNGLYFWCRHCGLTMRKSAVARAGLQITKEKMTHAA